MSWISRYQAQPGNTYCEAGLGNSRNRAQPGNTYCGAQPHDTLEAEPLV